MKAHITLALAVGCLLSLAALEMQSGAPPLTHAQGPTIRYVATTGADAGDCADPAHPCATVQYAVDRAAAGDEVHIATGVYTDVHQRAGITQTVYISKTVTLRGGYPADFGGPPDPAAHPSTLDAQGRGRVLYIAGAISPTVEGLRITGGNAAGLGGHPWLVTDAGGGIYVLTATVTLCHNQVFGNIASHGGGVHLYKSVAMVSNNAIVSNVAIWYGGGLRTYNGIATLNGNTISSNTAEYGGGLSVMWSDMVLLSNNIVSDNLANHTGGGLSLFDGPVIIRGNTIAANTSGGSGGGLSLWNSEAMLSGNTVTVNVAAGVGGGVDVEGNTVATFTGNTIAANTAEWGGGGLFLQDGTVVLDENTVAANVTDWDGGGLYLGYQGTGTLHGNVIIDNVAKQYGGGLYIGTSDTVLVNNLVAGNQANSLGSGLYIENTTSHLLHTTITCNGGGDGSGMYVFHNVGWHSTVTLTNTILVSQTVGITVTGGNTVTVNGVLWHDTPITISQAATATVTAQNQRWGNPAFLSPAAGDYHIGPGSAARDAGIDASVYTDIDGEPRPYQLPDLGADEYWPPGALKRLYLPLIWRS